MGIKKQFLCKIGVIKNCPAPRIPKQLFLDIAHHVFKPSVKVQPKEIIVVFGNDRDIKRLKRLFWGRSAVSDVVSFYDKEGGQAEILIDVDQAKRQAVGSLRREILFLYIHGLLHVAGHKDATAPQRRLMLKLGEAILKTARS